jgi:hypothetical protein
MLRRTIRISIIGAAVAAAAPAFGSTVAAIEAQASGTPATIDGSGDSAVITNILSQPGTGDGYTYTSWSFLVNDGTGSLDVFGKIPVATPYTPTVGDAITATGTYSPFDAIPEVETLTAISANSSGNAVGAPVSVTIPQLNTMTTSTFTILGHYLSLDNVMFTGLPSSGLWPVHATLNIGITDGTNNVTGFYWPSSYSTDDIYAGMPIPTGPVDLLGFADQFSGNTEFVPLVITPVPEPASIGLIALGGAMLMRRRSRRA